MNLSTRFRVDQRLIRSFANTFESSSMPENKCEAVKHTAQWLKSGRLKQEQTQKLHMKFKKRPSKNRILVNAFLATKIEINTKQIGETIRQPNNATKAFSEKANWKREDSILAFVWRHYCPLIRFQEKQVLL